MSSPRVLFHKLDNLYALYDYRPNLWTILTLDESLKTNPELSLQIVSDLLWRVESHFVINPWARCFPFALTSPRLNLRSEQDEIKLVS